VPYTVEFLRTADEELAGFSQDVQRPIVARIERLKDNPRPAGVEQLESPERFLRLRVGDYRVVYMIEGKHLVVLIVKVGHRKDIYDNLAALRQRVERWRRGRAR
jgi:mRNA interferase RelE/StbE